MGDIEMIKHLKVLSAIVILSMIVMTTGLVYANDNNYNNRINKISEIIKNAKLNNEKIDYPRLFIERGDCYSQLGDYENAMMDYNRVIKMKGASKYWVGIAYYGRAHIYERHMKYEESISNLNEAIRVNPKFFSAYAQRAVAYNGKGDYKKAFSDINIAIDNIKNNNNEKARFYAIRADIHENLKEYDKEIEDYSKAILLDSENDIYYQLRGYAYYDRKNYASSIADVSKQIEILEKKKDVGFNIESAYSWRASLYKKQKIYDNAINDYSYAIKYADKTPGDNFFYIQYLISRGCLYAIKNDNKKAINDFDLAESISDKVSLGRLYLSKALYYYNLGDNDSTIKYLQKSIKADKSSDKALKMYESIMKNETTGILTFEDLLSGI